ncbi:hypothetical protein XINFAN_00058 [Pseudogemmobacter humi]|uniref:Uncharacterized protein n=1 Tax=Pseudogemmobacter humi TaxID=2483812 RepID=A0A3P5WH27_9RHOB|nr:hypothetical protein [Pseudogemmobacter humi]VDC19058.1 hypothetical protein XINFAN_00058 [Pseudogemmobacter humi]
MGSGKSFATGIDFSHPPKPDIIITAQARHYMVITIHVGVDTAELSVARVSARTTQGGHDVPEDKIRARYERGQPPVGHGMQPGVRAAFRGAVIVPKMLSLIVQDRIISGRPVAKIRPKRRISV